MINAIQFVMLDIYENTIKIRYTFSTFVGYISHKNQIKKLKKIPCFEMCNSKSTLYLWWKIKKYGSFIRLKISEERPTFSFNAEHL